MMGLAAVLIVFAVLAAHARGQDSMGSFQWGLDLIIPSAPQECAPYTLWYNITDVHDPTLTDVFYPDSAAISFSTPDADQTTWMVLRPPMGTGYMTWTCNLAAGTSFSIKAKSMPGSYSNVYTVSPGSSSDCVNHAPPASQTTAFSHGSIIPAVYQTFTTAEYAVSSPPGDPFRSTQWHEGSFPTIAVPLGHIDIVAASKPSSGQGQTATPPAPTPPPDPNSSPAQVSSGRGLSSSPAGGSGTSSTTAGGSSISSTTATGPGFPTVTGTASLPSGWSLSTTAVSVSQSGSWTTVLVTSTVVGSPLQSGNSHSIVAPVVGALVGALLVGLGIGVAFMLWRRRLARRRRVEAPRPAWLGRRRSDSPNEAAALVSEKGGRQAASRRTVFTLGPSESGSAACELCRRLELAQRDGGPPLSPMTESSCEQCRQWAITGEEPAGNELSPPPRYSQHDGTKGAPVLRHAKTP